MLHVLVFLIAYNICFILFISANVSDNICMIKVTSKMGVGLNLLW